MIAFRHSAIVVEGWIVMALGLVLWQGVVLRGQALPASSDSEPQALVTGLFMDCHYGDRTDRYMTQLPVWRDLSGASSPPASYRSAMPERITWTGRLRVDMEGRYQFACAANGTLDIALPGVRLSIHSPAVTWGHSADVELTSGIYDVTWDWHPASIDDAPPYVGALCWRGPAGDFLPIPANAWFRPAAAQPPRATGMELAQRLGCTACHTPSTPQPNQAAAPSLHHVATTLQPDWLWQRLMRPAAPHADDVTSHNPSSDHASAASGPVTAGGAMPDYGLSRDKAYDLVAYLYQRHPQTAHDVVLPAAEDTPPVPSPATPPSAPPASASAHAGTPAQDWQAGRDLFLTVGCLACHTWQQLGPADGPPGGDLTQIARKRPASFFGPWLTNPAAGQPTQRMPQFPLAADEIRQLSAFLTAASEGDPSVAAPVSQVRPTAAEFASFRAPHRRARGRELFVRLRCAACHPEQASPPPAVPIGLDDEAWQRGCLAPAAEADSDRRVAPHFSLTARQMADLRAAWQATRWLPTGWLAPNRLAPFHATSDRLQMRDCLRCHRRGAHEGLAPTVSAVVARFPHLANRVSNMLPPALDYVGAKLQDAVLSSAMQGEQHMRPYLAVRMPKFAWQTGEVEQLRSAWMEEDRIGEQATTDRPFALSRLEADQAAPFRARLLTSHGFGCVSCHALGSAEPRLEGDKGRGPQLAGLAQRVRPEWFVRWLDQPSRLVPRVEMPAVRTPIPGLLQSHLPTQIEAVWQALADPHWELPPLDLYRVLRHAGGTGPPTRAHVILDVTRVRADQSMAAKPTDNGPPANSAPPADNDPPANNVPPADNRPSPDAPRTYIKPLLIGLSNRHNLLYDLEQGELAAWWLGDVGSQLVEGKRWLWEVSQPSWLQPRHGPEFRLVSTDGSTNVPPSRVGQFVTELDQYRHVADQVIFAHRLRFELPHQRATIYVEQTCRPLGGDSATRELSADTPQAPFGWQRTLRARGIPSGWALELRGGDGPAVRVTEPAPASGPTGTSDRTWHRGAPTGAGEVSWQLDYVSRIEPDRWAVVGSVGGTAGPPERLDLAPGWGTVRLTAPDTVLPTAFAWTPAGDTLVASLDGRLWRLTDRDGDGLEETWQWMADHLAAPMGMHAADDHVDIVHKAGLLRGRDRDGDGFLEEMTTIAAGWGHTADYHDWAVGLPRDAAGNYYVATGCQMDDRSAPAAHLRGQVLRLTPRTATPEEPHTYRLETISRGHRYPMGIALSDAGHLLVSDNQGHYNPFNEINHVQPNAHFGFVNFVDRHEPATTPTPPAIQVPHPWTRSVNGICCLTDGQVPGRFGPWQGHLLGCEYDLQALVRISLQSVGATLQGAIYPVTRHRDDAPRMLGAFSCAVAPGGDCYVGSFRESGWGAGNNVGEVLRFRFDPTRLPTGIAEVRVQHDGFQIRFSGPVDPVLGRQVTSYHIESYRRIATPEYGGADRDRRVERVAAVELSSDARQATLRLPHLRSGFVYEFQVAPLAQPDFFPAEAYYTLHVIPTPASRK